MRKQNSHAFLIFFFGLLLVSAASARLLLPKQGTVEETKAYEINSEDVTNLMGSEECAVKDQECLNRRMIAEAHLDYIYTQHHKP